MKAILRSINNFSCKLKQSNNLKYNISPKIRSNKFKSISGNGNVTIEDALNKDLKDYKVYGNTYQNSTSGKNKFNINQNVTYISNRLSCDVVNDDIVLTALTDYNGNAYCTKPIPNSSSLLGQTVTLSGNMQRSSQGTFRIILVFLNNTGGYVSDLGSSTAITSDGQHATFDLPSNFPTGATQMGIMLYFSRVGDTIHQGDTVTYSNVQLEIGSNKTSYEKYTGGQPSPNPDYPQEIVSCGDRTKNLLNVPSTYTVERTNIDYSLQLGTYIVSCESPENYRRLLFFRWKENTNNGDYVYIEANTTSTEFTITKEVSKLNFYSRDSSSVSAGNTSTYKNLMIRKSNISDGTYEPYGYKIPINVRSKNVLKLPDMPSQVYRTIYTKINDNSFKIEPDGTAGATGYARLDLTDLVKPNTTYTFSRTISKIGYNFINGGSARVDINGTLGSVIDTDSFNIVVPSTITRVWLYLYIAIDDNNLSRQTGSVTFNNMMLEEGSTVSSKYIPYYNQTTNIYLDEPLRKIDEYSDYIDFINGKVVRRLKEIILDENSTLSVIEIITSNNKFIWRYTTVLDIIGSGARSNILSNNYIGDKTVYSANNKIGVYVNSNGITNFATLLSTVGATTNSTITQVLNLLKTWLSLHHTELIYPLATPTEESITLPNINLIEGKNIITIGTEVQGVFEVEYYSKEIIDISDYKYNLRKVED